MNYTEQLAHPNWQKKKAEIMARDNFKCCRCGSGSKTLQVHHKEYVKRRMAWQYLDSQLETLCWECHRKEHFDKPIAPAKIWEGLEDRPTSTTEERVRSLQEKLKQPLDDELQMQILAKISELRKGMLNGGR